jgi:hypothetical protein
VYGPSRSRAGMLLAIRTLLTMPVPEPLPENGEIPPHSPPRPRSGYAPRPLHAVVAGQRRSSTQPYDQESSLNRVQAGRVVPTAVGGEGARGSFVAPRAARARASTKHVRATTSSPARDRDDASVHLAAVLMKTPFFCNVTVVASQQELRNVRAGFAHEGGWGVPITFLYGTDFYRDWAG